MGWIVKEGGDVPEGEFVGEYSKNDDLLNELESYDLSYFVSIFFTIIIIIVLIYIYIIWFIKVSLTGRWYCINDDIIILIDHNIWSNKVILTNNKTSICGLLIKNSIILENKDYFTYCEYYDTLHYKNKMFKRL
jgi:hypothetical protein